MRIYIDENISDPRLVAYLTKQGHSVLSSVDASTRGNSDARQLTYALIHSYTTLTRDVVDFRDLHELVITAGGAHPGIMLIYSGDDPARDLTPRGIATAIAKLESSGVAVANGIHTLNDWR